MANPNLPLLIDAAQLLKPILGELVFVGGCATALLITDKAAPEVRPTFDVDAIAEITSYAKMRSSPRNSESSASRKICGKVLPLADGANNPRCWM